MTPLRRAREFLSCPICLHWLISNPLLRLLYVFHHFYREFNLIVLYLSHILFFRALLHVLFLLFALFPHLIYYHLIFIPFLIRRLLKSVSLLKFQYISSVVFFSIRSHLFLYATSPFSNQSNSYPLPNMPIPFIPAFVIGNYTYLHLPTCVPPLPIHAYTHPNLPHSPLPVKSA